MERRSQYGGREFQRRDGYQRPKEQKDEWFEHYRKKLESTDFTNADESEYLPTNGLIDRMAKAFNDNYRQPNNLKSTQIRNIYDSFLKIKSSLDGKKDMKSCKVMLNQIYPQIAYAKGRGLVPATFHSFVDILLKKSVGKDGNVDPISFGTSFNMYQAFIAYFKFHGGK